MSTANYKKTLGIPRKDMPQIKSTDVDEFIDFLKQTKGVNSSKQTVMVKRLKPTQKDFNPEKVEKLKTAPMHVLQKVIIASSDNYILDGHHRYSALLELDPNAKMPIIKVGVKISKLLELADEFPKTFRKSINECMSFNAFRNQ